MLNKEKMSESTVATEELDQQEEEFLFEEIAPTDHAEDIHQCIREAVEVYCALRGIPSEIVPVNDLDGRARKWNDNLDAIRSQIPIVNFSDGAESYIEIFERSYPCNELTYRKLKAFFQWTIAYGNQKMQLTDDEAKEPTVPYRDISLDEMINEWQQFISTWNAWDGKPTVQQPVE